MKKVLVKKFVLLTLMLIMMSTASAQSISYTGDFNLANLQSYNGTPFSTIGYESIPEGITFRPDGMKMYITGQGSDAVNQFSLTTPFNINSGVTHDGSYSVAAQYTNPRIYGVAFSNDGMKMFVVGTSGDEINQYNLTTPFDITSGVSHNDSYNLISGALFIEFNNDGTRMYVSESMGITQYTLSVAYDLSSTITDNGTYTPSTYVAEEMVFTADGMKMLVTDQNNDVIHQYDLSTPYEITSGVTDNGITFDLSGEESFPSGLAISPDNAHIFVMGLASGNQRIRQYDMATTNISEAGANDGSVTGSSTILIYGDTFTSQGSTLTLDTDYTISNMPSGLTPTISVAAGGQTATLTFSGNATNHQALNTVSSLEIDFANSAFTGNDASAIYNADGSGTTSGIVFDNNKYLSYGNGFNLSEGATFELTAYVGNRGPFPREVVFSNDGMKFFVVGSDGANAEVNQYSLSSAYNIAAGVSFNGQLNVTAQEGLPYGIAFNDDGTKMFIIGSEDEINEYDLNTPFTVTSGVTHVTNHSSASNLRAIVFGANGQKMYMIRNWTTVDQVYQYTLSTPYDVASASYDGLQSIQSEESQPEGLAFNATGTQMYVTGNGSDAVHQYSLNEPFDITSGITYGGVLVDVSGQDNSPNGVTFSADGAYMFVCGMQGQDVNQYILPTDQFVETGNNDGSVEGFLTIQISGDAFDNAGSTLTHGVDYTITNLPSGLTPSFEVNGNGSIAKLTFSNNATDNQNVDDLSEIAISYANSAFVSGDASDVLGISDPTGVGIDFRDNNPSLYYGTGFDINYASYGFGTYSFAAIDNQVTSMRFNADGTKVFIFGKSTNSVHQYSLSSPYVIDENMTSDGTPYDISSTLTDAYGLAFNTNGTKMYLADNTTDGIHQFTLTSAFDVTSGVSYDGSPFIVTEDGVQTALTFNEDGSIMYVVGVTADKVYQYALNTPFDVTAGATYQGEFSILSEEASAGGILFVQNGTKMLIVGSLGDEVNQYNLAFPYDITAGVTFDTNYSMSNEDFGPTDLLFNPDGTTMYMLGGGYDAIYTYNIEKGGFAESSKNDGSATGSLAIQLSDETFSVVDGELSSGTHYSVTNLPAGFTSVISVDANGKTAALTLDGNATDHQDMDDLAGLIITFQDAAFEGDDASNVSYANAFDTGIGIDFRDNNPAIYYGDALNLANTSFSGNTVNILPQDSYATGIAFNDDGTRFFTSGGDNSMVYEYSLALPYDLSSTFAYTGNSLDLNGNARYPEDLAFSPDGTRLYILSSDNYEMVQYNLSTGFDLSTASHSFTYGIESIDDSPYGLSLSSDGTKIYLLGTDNYAVYQFTMSTAYELSSASFDGSPFLTENETTSGSAVAMSNDGRFMIVVADDGTMVRYILNAPFDLTAGATYAGVSFDLTGQDEYSTGVALSPDGSKIFVVGYDVGIVSQYDVNVGGFTEAASNDGTVEGDALIFIVDDQFASAGSTLTYTTDYTINNLPAGLTPALNVAADGYSATLTFTGMAGVHGNANEVEGLEFDFNSSAFVESNANEVANAVDHESNLTIDFTPYTGNDILTFTFSEIEGSAVIDAGETAVDAEAVAGTDISSLTPIITLSQNATVVPNSEASQDFTSSVVYTVTADDGTEKEWDVTITEALADPTDIMLSSTTVDENSGPGTVVATLSVEDESFLDSHDYYVVAVLEDDDWQSFDIDGTNLITTDFITLDFETKSSFTFELEVRDNNGGIYSEDVTITLNDVNEAPTDIDITNKTVDESTPIGTVIGVLSTDDVDAGDTHTYTYTLGCSVCDPIGDEPAPFEIVGNELRTAVVFDFETEDTYEIDVTSTDAGGLTRTDGFIIRINDLPAQVTSLDLSNQAINENENSGAAIGIFTTTGEDLSGSYTYTLVSGDGDDDNASFSISNDQLLSSASFDFETKSSYSIRVMTSDGALTREEAFTITVANVSEAPTGIELSANTIAENNAVNAVIGSLTTTDEDEGETHTYALVAGDGDADNASFNINGAELRATGVFDFESKNSYSVRIETNDGNGGTYQEEFTISIDNTNESISVAAAIEDQSLEEGFASIEIDLSNVFVDADGDNLTYAASSSNTSIVTVSNSGSTLTITEVGVGTSTISVTADDGSGETTSDEFDVTIAEIPLGLGDEITLEVYPNPTSDFVNINGDKVLQINLINLNGQILRSTSGQAVKIDLRGFSSGTYLLKITDGESTATRRIIKAN